VSVEVGICERSRIFERLQVGEAGGVLQSLAETRLDALDEIVALPHRPLAGDEYVDRDEVDLPAGQRGGTLAILDARIMVGFTSLALWLLSQPAHDECARAGSLVDKTTACVGGSLRDRPCRLMTFTRCSRSVATRSSDFQA
jgi:hypothetical protein